MSNPSKPVSEDMLDAIIQFNPHNGKFYLMTHHKWFMFYCWKKVREKVVNFYSESSYKVRYFPDYDSAAQYAKNIGLNLVS